MWKIGRVISGSVTVAIGLTGIAVAHHSMTAYEGAKEVTIAGIVTEIRWFNPHAFVYVDAVTIDGQAASGQNWGGEMPNPRTLRARGWNKESVKVGDELTITGPARKDGAPLVLTREVSLPDGTHISFRAGAGQ